jgi:hypothetical protein
LINFLINFKVNGRQPQTEDYLHFLKDLLENKGQHQFVGKLFDLLIEDDKTFPLGKADLGTAQPQLAYCYFWVCKQIHK